MRKVLTAFSLFAMTTALTACGSDLFKEAKPADCPDAQVLQHGEQILKYKPGPGRDITDVILEAEFTRVFGQCEVDDENVEAGLGIALTAKKGPALETDRTSTTIILAVVDGDKKILERQELNVELDFSGNRSKINYFERFLIDIPLKEGQSSGDFSIYVSFGLSREELDYNKKSKLY